MYFSFKERSLLRLSTRKTQKITNSESVCAVRNSQRNFFFLSHSEGKIVAKDDVENFSLKNNVISNPKGKLIFTFKVFTITNTKIMSKPALLRQRHCPPRLPTGLQRNKPLLSP